MSGPLHAWGVRFLQTWRIASLTVTGNTTLGDATGDTVTINGQTGGVPNGLSLTGPFFAITSVGATFLGVTGSNGFLDIVDINGTTQEWRIYGKIGTTARYRIRDETAGADRFAIESDGRIYGTALHNNAGSVTGTTNQYIASGKYTPTLTGVANVGSSTAYECNWNRVGNVVSVAGRVDIDPTAATTITKLGMSLPIPSDFTADQLGGSGWDPAFSQGIAVYADQANNRAQFDAVMISNLNQSFFFTFQYEVV